METPERLTYSESRTINVGDYESVKCELRYSSEIATINEKEKTIEVGAEDTQVLRAPTKEEFLKASQKAVTRVRKILDAREMDIRIRSARFTDFDTCKKGMFQSAIGHSEWFKKQNKFAVDASEIEEAEDNG